MELRCSICDGKMIEYQNIARRGRLYPPTSLCCSNCGNPASKKTVTEMTDIEKEFEKTCNECRGVGYDIRYIGEKKTCPKCGGIGMIPTEIGEKVLELVMHNLKSLLKELTK